jgi:hypothetical protein
VGRGLSPLQRHILAEAAKVERLYYADILSGYFGWQKSRAWVGSLQNFSMREIGEARYRRTMAVLSRSCARLAERGLVRMAHSMAWTGASITWEGREWLSANTVPSGNSVSR